MEILLLVGLALMLLWQVRRTGLRLTDGAIRVLVRGIAMWHGGRDDALSHGLQEEDRDRRWGSGEAPLAAASRAARTPLSRVAPVVRSR